MKCSFMAEMCYKFLIIREASAMVINSTIKLVNENEVEITGSKVTTLR